MKQGFPEVKFTKEFTSFQGNYCSRFKDCLRRVPRWRLASSQQKMMSLQKKGYPVKVSFLSLRFVSFSLSINLSSLYKFSFRYFFLWLWCANDLGSLSFVALFVD